MINEPTKREKYELSLKIRSLWLIFLLRKNFFPKAQKKNHHGNARN